MCIAGVYYYVNSQNNIGITSSCWHVDLLFYTLDSTGLFKMISCPLLFGSWRFRGGFTRIPRCRSVRNNTRYFVKSINDSDINGLR